MKKETTNKKYELGTKHPSTNLYRVVALRNFSNVKKGDIGGWVRCEKNLSHYGDCWVYDEAEIHNFASVYGNAKVFGNATVMNRTEIFEDARVFENATVFHEAKIYGNAEVFQSAKIWQNAKIFGKARVFGNVLICGEAQISGKVDIHSSATISQGILSKSGSFLDFTGVGSADGTLTAVFSDCGQIFVTRGCFTGTLEEFTEAVKNKHAFTMYEKEYNMLIEIIRNRSKIIDWRASFNQ